MIKRLATRFVVVLLFALAASGAQATQPRPLTIGHFPNLSTRLLLETYQPLRESLEVSLGRPVMVYTAADFTSFYNRTRSAEFDLVITPPHFALLAQQDAGYRPLFAYRNNIAAALVVAKKGPVGKIADLRGTTIASPDRLALVTMLGMQLLKERGLEPGRDYTFRWSTTHGNAALSVIRGEAQAALIGILPLKQLPENILSQLHVMTATPTVSSQIILANSRLDPKLVERIRIELLHFEQTAEGHQFFKTTGLAGLTPIDGASLKQFEPYAGEVKRMLEPPR